MKSLDDLSLQEIDALIARKRSSTKPEEKATSKLESFGRGITSAIPGANKAIGAIGAGVARALRPELFEDESFKETYAKGRDLSTAQNQRASKDNPGTSLLGGLLGGIGLPFPAKSIKGAAGLGAGYGAAYGIGASNEGEAGTIDANDILAGLYGAPLGAAAGGIGQLVGNKLFGNGRNVNQQAVENLDIADNLGLPLTKAEATRNPQDILRQEAAEKGRMGAINQRKMDEFSDARKRQFQDTVQNTRSNIGGGSEFVEKGSAAGQTITGIQERALQDRKAYSDLYTQAKEKVANVSTDDLKDFPKVVTKDFEEQVLTPDNATKAFGELGSLNKILEEPTISLKKLEAWKQGLNRSIRETAQGGQEEFALKQLSNKFDGYLDGVIEKALVEGDATTLDQFKNARGLAKEWFGKYQAGNKGEFGKAFLEDVIDNARFSREPYSNEMLVNKIFGASDLGFKPQSASIVKELKKLSTPDEFNNLKLEAANKLVSPLLKENPNVQTYINNLNKLVDSNPTLARELFSNAEIKSLQDIGEYARLSFTRPKSQTNPSGTAAEIIDHFTSNKVTGFVKNLFNRIELDQSKIRNAIEKGEVVPNELNAVTRAAILGTEGNLINNLVNKEERLDSLSVEEIDKLIGKHQNKETKTVIDKIGKAESGGNYNARNKNSSAYGKYQFTKDTWRDLVKNNPDLNLKVSDIRDPKAQEKAITRFTEDNISGLIEVLGRKPSNGEIYTAHFLGLNGAKKLLNANPKEKAAKINSQAAKANKSIFFAGNNPRTVEEVLKILEEKVI